MKKATVVLILSLVFSFVLVSFPELNLVKAEPRTIVVPADYSSIQDAVDNATDGDTVFVRSGYYFGSAFINKSLSLVGEDANTTFIVVDDYRLNGTVVLVRHDNVNITGFTIRSNNPTSSRRAIHLLHARYCNVSGNIITNCAVGIWLYGASENTIIGNSISEIRYGIDINLSDTNTFVDNVVTGGIYGVRLISSTGNTFRNNNMTGNHINFDLSGSDPLFFFNYADNSNTVDGKSLCYWVNRSYETVPSDVEYVILVNCTGITVQDNDDVKSFKDIRLLYTNSSLVRNTDVPVSLVFSFHNKITHNSGTVRLENSSYNTITENTIKYTDPTIYLTGSSGNIISGNTVTSGSGISISSSSNDNIITNNTLSSNHRGIHLYGSSRNILQNNRLINNRDQFFVSSPDSSPSHFVNHVDTSNTVNGNPIYYLVNRRGFTVQSDAGYVVLVNCTKMNVENLNFTDEQGIVLAWTTNSNITSNSITDGQGIYLVCSSSGNTVSGNVVRTSKYGVYVSHAFDNVIVGNNISSITRSGVHLSGSQCITVSGNTIKANDQYGIALVENAVKNTVSENHIEYNNIGIYVEDSSENLISGNMIIRNDNWGMQLRGGQHNNSIYHNYFIDNRQWKDGLQVSIPGIDEDGLWVPGYGNTWDDDKLGNYWNGYLQRYQNATEIGDTGIGDTPFQVNPNNIDNYPVVKVDLIPEFPSWIILPLVTIATLLIIICKKRLPKNR